MYIYLYLAILKETLIIWGIQGSMYLSILKGAFIIWGVVFGIMYLYIYVSFNIKRGFYYLGDSGNYVYIYVSFNIKRGFYYLGGSFWRCVFIYPQFARCLK